MARTQFKVTFTNAQPGAPVEILTPSTEHVYPSAATATPVGGKQLYLDGTNAVTVWSDAQAVIAQTVDGTGVYIQGTATTASPTITVTDGTAPTNPPFSAAYVGLTQQGREQLQAQRAAALLTWYAALANRDYAAAKIVCLGDSVTEGYYSTAIGRRWTDKLRDRLRVHFPSNGVTTGGAGYRTHDQDYPLGAFASGSSQGASYGLGLWNVFMPSGSTYTFTSQGTSLDIYYTQKTGQQGIQASVDGGANVQTPTFGTGTGSKKLHVPMGTSGSHSVVISTYGGGSTTLEGVAIFDGDESAGFTMFNGGHTAYATSDFLAVPSGLSHTTNYDFAASVQPDLVVITLGINDWLFKSITAAQFQTNLASIVSDFTTPATVPPSIVLNMLYKGGSSAQQAAAQGGANAWSDYAAAAWAVAAASSNVCVHDLSLRIPPFVTSNAQSLGYSDQLHLTDKGHSWLADDLLQFLRPA